MCRGKYAGGAWGVVVCEGMKKEKGGYTPRPSTSYYYYNNNSGTHEVGTSLCAFEADCALHERRDEPLVRPGLTRGRRGGCVVCSILETQRPPGWVE